jgi:hypothetical protein
MNSKLVTFLCALFTIALFAEAEAQGLVQRDAEAEAQGLIQRDAEAEANPDPYYYYYKRNAEAEAIPNPYYYYKRDAKFNY